MVASYRHRPAARAEPLPVEKARVNTAMPHVRHRASRARGTRLAGSRTSISHAIGSACTMLSTPKHEDFKIASVRVLDSRGTEQCARPRAGNRFCCAWLTSRGARCTRARPSRAGRHVLNTITGTALWPGGPTGCQLRLLCTASDPAEASLRKSFCRRCRSAFKPWLDCASPKACSAKCSRGTCCARRTGRVFVGADPKRRETCAQGNTATGPMFGAE